MCSLGQWAFVVTCINVPEIKFNNNNTTSLPVSRFEFKWINIAITSLLAAAGRIGVGTHK